MAPCFEAIYYDIDWNDKVDEDRWSWIYFWVRDPDLVAMKAVDVGDCPTDEWPYEYVNNGPKYSICQDFRSVYDRVHGVAGVDVRYYVGYESGVPPTATAGPTTTPPDPDPPWSP